MQNLVAVRRHGRQLLLQRRYLHRAPAVRLNKHLRMPVVCAEIPGDHGMRIADLEHMLISFWALAYVGLWPP